MFMMARGFAFTNFVYLLSCFANLRVQAVACYYPNGELSPDDTPCYNNRAVSVCCGQGYACLDNGICKVVIDTNVPDDIQYLRGSCTDHFFGPGCPQFCIGSQYADDGGNTMQMCNSTTFCCYGGTPMTCNCQTGFNVTVLTADDYAFTTIDQRAAASSTAPASSSTSTSTSISASTSTSTSTTTTAASAMTAGSSTLSDSAAAATSTGAGAGLTRGQNSGGLTTSAKIGIGVGVLIGVMAIAILGFMYGYLKRTHGAVVRQAGLYNTYLPQAGQNGQTYRPYADSQDPNSYNMQEMPSQPKQQLKQQLYPSELPGLQR